MTALAVGFGLLCSAAWAQPPLLVTDWTDVPGRIWTAANGSIRPLYEAAEGRIYSVALGPEGAIYFSNHNTHTLERWTGEGSQVLYTHGTYLRDVAFDPGGVLHFSESSGARADGAIYRLVDGVASVAYPVRLAEVDGFWAGNFAFDPSGTLHISTGNRRGAGIYRWTGSGWRLFFERPATSITGFSFDGDGNLYYADWNSRVYRVDPAGVSSVALWVSGRRFADVQVLDGSVALGPEAGRVNHVARHPSVATTLYAVTSSGGVYRSTDGGATWFWRSHGIGEAVASQILVLSGPPSALILVTQGGIYRSLDEGGSWGIVQGVPRQVPPALERESSLLHSQQPNPAGRNQVSGALFAAPWCSGLFRSDDGGARWTRVFGAGSYLDRADCVTSIDPQPDTPGVIIATPNGLLESADGNPPWVPIGTEIDDAGPWRVQTSPASPGWTWVSAINLDGSGTYNTRVWLRRSRTEPFARTAPLPWGGSWNFSLAVDPVDRRTAAFGGILPYVTRDEGGLWTETRCGIGADCGVDYRGLTFSAPEELMAPHDQGIFRHRLGSGVFEPIDAGLANTQFYDLDLGNGDILYGGTQDTGLFMRDSLGDWQGGFSIGGSGDTLDVLVDPADPRRVFVRNNGEELQIWNVGMPAVESTGLEFGSFHNQQLVYDPATGTLYAGTRFRGVYKSGDDGATFGPTGPELTGHVRSLGLRPGSDSEVWAGTLDRGLFLTIDGGLSWAPLPAYPAPDALSIEVLRTGTVFVGSSEGIFTSDDRGTTWRARNTGLPPRRVVSDIEIDPACSCRMWVGLGYYTWQGLYGGGVYESTDAGLSWTRLSTEDEAVATVPSVRLASDRRTLFAATHGSGIRQYVSPIRGGCGC